MGPQAQRTTEYGGVCDPAEAERRWRGPAIAAALAACIGTGWTFICCAEGQPAATRASAAKNARPSSGRKQVEANTTAPQTAKRQRADFDSIAQHVQGYLARLPGYQPRDLISRRDAEAILNCVSELGWTPGDRATLLKLVPDDRSLLVRKLRSPSGKKLMRDCARRGLPFDVLDRLSTMPDGERILQSLINGPDGYKLVEYMATAPGGHALGHQLAATLRGKDFHQPTGRIYTAEQLLAHLKQAYNQDHGP